MASSELRVFTREELAKYDGGRSALRKARETGEPLDRSQVYSTYISIHGMVYDVTQFLGRHPGGPDEILRYAGKVRCVPLAAQMLALLQA